jgi:5-methylcytosine-specific restriction protein A
MDFVTDFVIGKSYRRSDMHKEYGGQQQGGIATPTSMQAVWLFTGDSGAKYGYKDAWVDERTFRYYGEGQYGDMKFLRGNRAIRDHIKSGECLLLFERLSGGFVKFLGNMSLESYNVEKGKDLDLAYRDVIVFTLKRVDKAD